MSNKVLPALLTMYAALGMNIPGDLIPESKKNRKMGNFCRDCGGLFDSFDPPNGCTCCKDLEEK